MRGRIRWSPEIGEWGFSDEQWSASGGRGPQISVLCVGDTIIADGGREEWTVYPDAKQRPRYVKRKDRSRGRSVSVTRPTACLRDALVDFYPVRP